MYSILPAIISNYNFRGAALIFGTKYANTGEKERFSKIIEKLLPDILSASQDVASGDIRVNALYAIVQVRHCSIIKTYITRLFILFFSC